MTTNNHPAHGPVSLDRLHQISEILSKAAQSDGGNLGYAMADAVKVIDGAIAAFGTEPVGYFYAEKPGDWYQISDGDRVPDHRRIPLYSSPQSGQVVKLPNEFISNDGYRCSGRKSDGCAGRCWNSIRAKRQRLSYSHARDCAVTFLDGIGVTKFTVRM
jgi:hypothetical protein